MENQLYIQNSLTRKKELFIPISAPNVGMYVCGPTVYSDVHLGNVRTFLSFDIVFRYLKFIGYKVRYVRNITDVGHLVGDGDEGDNNTKVDLSYKNESYWNLPQQVREAIDKAKIKNKKSEFYYKLKDLKFNIKRYQGLFNTKMTQHHRSFLMKK